MSDSLSETRSYNDLVAEEIRVLMARKRVTQTTLARRIGVTQPWVSRRVSGGVPLDVDDLDRIAGGLDVPISAFFPEPSEGLRKGHFLDDALDELVSTAVAA